MNSDVLVGDRVNYPSYYSANFLIILLISVVKARKLPREAFTGN